MENKLKITSVILIELRRIWSIIIIINIEYDIIRLIKIYLKNKNEHSS